jgi:hypothetical protein
MTSAKSGWVVKLGPGALLGIMTGEFLLLVLLLVGYQFNWVRLHKLPTVIGNVLPLIVPWGGALGGICIGLVGVTAHWAKWNQTADNMPSRQALTWNGWYLVRAPLGAALGTIAALIVVLFLGTVARTNDGTVNVTPVGAATLMVVAFVVGYKQETFRQLLERAVDVILGPGTPTPANDSFTLDAAKLDFGPTAVNGEERKNLGITNQGRRLLVIAKNQITTSGDGFAVTQLPGNLPGGDIGQIEISFRPTKPGTHSGSVTITINAATRIVELTGTSR